MKRRISSLVRTTMLGVTALGIVAPLAISAASCADSSNAGDDSDAAATSIPVPDVAVENGDDAGSFGPLDAGCEAGDPRCTTTELTCDDADWCPVANAVDARILLTSIWGSSKDDVWAVGTAGGVVHYDGSSWKPYPISTQNTLFAVWGSGPSDIWAVSSFDNSFHGTGAQDADGGWSKLAKLPIPFSYDLFPGFTSVWGTSPTNVWVGGGDKLTYPYTKIWRSKFADDGGLSWATHSPCSGSTDCPGIRAIWGSSESDIWLVGDRGRTYHTIGLQTDGGLPFTNVESQTIWPLRAVWGSDSAHVWSVGDQGTIRRIGEGEPVWTPVESPTTNDLRGIWGSSANDVWVVGGYGTILHFDGTAWTPSTAAFAKGPTPTIYGIWGSGPNDVWAVGEGIVLHYTGKGRKGTTTQ